MTIYDISKKAGVSIATVSRVLNGSDKVRPSTKKKVMDIIEKYDYTPNAFARGMGLHSLQTIGILCADSSDLFLAKAVYYLEQELQANGYEPKEGSVLIQGVPAQDIPDAEKRHLFGYVEQAFHMVPGTVKEQITLYDPSITMEDVRAAAQMTGLSDTIMSLENGYDTPCSDEIFSQGQWQLLSIARAAAAKPKLLLLDEITANLDAQTEKEVLQALKRVSENRTVISISHRVNATTGRVIQI